MRTTKCYPVYAFVCTDLSKERCHAKFLEGHLNELGLLIGPSKSGSFLDEAA